MKKRLQIFQYGSEFDPIAPNRYSPLDWVEISFSESSPSERSLSTEAPSSSTSDFNTFPSRPRLIQTHSGGSPLRNFCLKSIKSRMEEMSIDFPSGISMEYFTYQVLLGEDEAGVLDPTFLTEVLDDLQQPGHIVSCDWRFLAMHYTPHVDLAFNSVEHIMGDVEGGWLIRYMHANWATFIGYVPPWGQMSFWGATVITSLASAIPVVGDTIVTWLWGGFSVDNATLNRFFSLHHLLPFLLVGASLLQLAALHQYGSNNPLGVHSEMDKIASYPYFYVKDLVGWVAFAIFSSIFIFYAPNVLGHPDNYIPANPMPTPPHIVPEWYFLPIHAILRSIPDKAGGVAAIAPVFICLLALPFFKSMYVRSSSFRPIHQGIFWLLLADRLLLGWIGCQPVEAPFVTIGQISPFVFFLFFAITPILGRVGRGIPNSYTDETA
ncbi:apocytochrome b [Tanacetum coccineum]|uniref:Cytochrome b n=2 Tax=Asteraceae TaxID=4210 RepID=A0ABQ5ELA6_9ASTR